MVNAESAVRVLENMAGSSALSPEIVAKLKAGYDEIDAARVQAQSFAARDFEGLTPKDKG